MMLMNDYFPARRVLPHDLAAVLAFYTRAGREYSFADAATLHSLWQSGELWACFDGAAIAALGGFVRLDAQNRLCDAVQKTAFLPHQTLLLLPPVFAEGFPAAGRFCDWCRQRAMQYLNVHGGGGLAALVPVKSGGTLLPLYFAMRLQLVAMRPLDNLRPYFIFLSAGLDICADDSIIVPISDTFTLSKLLETGYVATDALLQDGILHLRVQAKRTETDETCHTGWLRL